MPPMTLSLLLTPRFKIRRRAIALAAAYALALQGLVATWTPGGAALLAAGFCAAATAPDSPASPAPRHDAPCCIAGLCGACGAVPAGPWPAHRLIAPALAYAVGVVPAPAPSVLRVGLAPWPRAPPA